MSTTSATCHSGTEVVVVEGLEPATAYEHHGIAYADDGVVLRIGQQMGFSSPTVEDAEKN